MTTAKLGTQTLELNDFFHPHKNRMLGKFVRDSTNSDGDYTPKMSDAITFLKQLMEDNREAIKEAYTNRGFVRLDKFFETVPSDLHYVLFFAKPYGSASMKLKFTYEEQTVTTHNVSGVTNLDSINSFVNYLQGLNHLWYWDLQYSSADWVGEFVYWSMGGDQFNQNNNVPRQLPRVNKVNELDTIEIVPGVKRVINRYVDPNSRTDLHDLFNYSANVCDKIQGPYGDGSKSTLYGIELELATDYQVKDIVDAFKDRYAFCKSDSSVNGNKNNRYEVVSKPATLRQHKINWATFFKRLDLDKFDTTDRTNNGCHIHIDRNAFDKDMAHLKKFSWFFSNPLNNEFLKIMSDRKDNFQYAQLYTSKSLKHAETTLMGGGKNTCVNFQKSATIEVRLFKGIVSFATILKNLEFVDAILEYTRGCSWARCDYNSFLSWLDTQPTSNYRSLKLCVKENDFSRVEIIGKIKAAFGPNMTDRKITTTINSIPRIREFSAEVETEFYSSAYGNSLEFKVVDGMFIFSKPMTKYAKFDDLFLSAYNVG